MRNLLAWLSVVCNGSWMTAQTLPELTAVLAKAETVDDEAVGDGGIKSETRRSYEQWRGKATVQELRQLTSHESQVVRAYAVQALIDTEATVDWPAIAQERLLDKAEVTTFEGCCKSKQLVGDVVFTRVRSHLTAEQLLDVAEALIAKESPLFAREWVLRSLRLRDGMLHTVRDLARNGDAPAGIALARYGLPIDVPILVQLLQAESPFDDNAWFIAAAIHGDPRLLTALTALEGKAKKRSEADNPSRLLCWLQAIAAQQSPEAGAFLLQFLRTVEPGGSFHENDLLTTYKQALVAHPDCQAFDEVRAEIKQRIEARRK